MEKTKSGFTLLEVILVVAISTLLFMSVVIGIGSRIATSRYETAANEITDELRDVFTVAMNTENSRQGIEGAREYCTLYGAVGISENGDTKYGKKLFVNTDINKDISSLEETDLNPGRTNCAIYGKAIYFGIDKENPSKVYIFDVVGDVVTNFVDPLAKDKSENTELKIVAKKTDVLEQLEYVRADIFAAIPETKTVNNEVILDSTYKLSPAGSVSTYEPNWGALFKTANFGDNGRDPGDDFIGMVMIVRSPATGNISTFFYEWPDNTSIEDMEIMGLLGSDLNGGEFNENSGAYKDIVKKYSPVSLLLEQKEKQASEDEDSNNDKNKGFCVGSDDFYVAISGLKKYVEFIPGGQNASAIKLNESKDNPCYGT